MNVLIKCPAIQNGRAGRQSGARFFQVLTVLTLEGFFSDPVYGGRGAQLFARQALHAWKLAFVHPRSQEPARFESKMPADFRKLIAGLRA